MKYLKKNQLAILVIALMLVTAGYLNYNSKDSIQTGSNVINGNKIAAIGDATLVNSGELLEEKDKQSILNNINAVNEQNKEAGVVDNEQSSNQTEENVNIDTAITTNATEEKKDDYFDLSRLDRDKMYSQMIESYQKLLESNSISSEQKAISGQEITKINQTKNAIMITENLISTKGFKDSVIFVNDTSVSVVVNAEKLETEQIAQLQNIISRELKVDISNINISNR